MEPSPPTSQSLHLPAPNGPVESRYFPTAAPKGAALFVGGITGGWHSPAGDLYTRLGTSLSMASIAALWLRYRQPGQMPACLADLNAGLRHLQPLGPLALIGHSFGAAVAIQAAAAAPQVRTVVTLGGQSKHGEAIAQLGPRCSVLLLHGDKDQVVPTGCSRYLHQLARPPKQLGILPATGHNLDEAATAVYMAVRNWVIDQLAQPSPANPTA